MKKLLLIDANSLIHRAFHALPPLISSDGRPSGALYGLSSLLIKTLKEEKPDYVAAAFDRPEPTFRKEMFDDYKAKRPKAPDELISQIIEARELFKVFNIKTFEKPGFEADDIIGTLAKKFGQGDISVTILTGDLDSLQLVDDGKVLVKILKKGVSETSLYDEGAVIGRYGLPPALLPDYKGLVGDKSDNIPGIKNVGPKTAEKLLKRFGSLENIFSEGSPEDKELKNILPFKEIALISKELGKIKCDVPLNLNIIDLKTKSLPKNELEDYFKRWDFKSLSGRIEGTPKESETKILNAFFISKEEDLNETKLRSKNFKVAWEWKPIIKSLIKKDRETPLNIFDIFVAFWLNKPESVRLSKEIIIKNLTGREPSEDESDWKNSFLILKNKIEKNGLSKVFYEIEMPLVEVLAEMEMIGIKIDKASAQKTLGEMRNVLEGLSRDIYKEAGSVFNINSPKQVSEIIFKGRELKSKRIKKTKSGQPSTSFEALSSIRGEKIIDLILSYRETFKMESTYLAPIINLSDDDNRLRTSFVQTSTSTGRLSSEKPNLQNIPQESSWSKKIRDVFISDEGWSLVSFDYSQLELRLLADVSGDINLIDAFLKNLDIHTKTASEIFGIPEEKVTKEERRVGKTLNFGVVYGMGPRAFSEMSGVSQNEAAIFIKKYFDTFPTIKKWQDETKLFSAENGFVENKNGRKRWFDKSLNQKIISDNERAAINMPIQSLEADIIKTAMIKTNHLGSGIKLILTIHDELLFEIRDDILIEAADKIRKIMENIDKFAVPLKVEVKHGKKWGSLEKYEY